MVGIIRVTNGGIIKHRPLLSESDQTHTLWSESPIFVQKLIVILCLLDPRKIDSSTKPLTQILVLQYFQTKTGFLNQV